MAVSAERTGGMPSRCQISVRRLLPARDPVAASGLSRADERWRRLVVVIARGLVLGLGAAGLLARRPVTAPEPAAGRASRIPAGLPTSYAAAIADPAWTAH